MTRVKTKKKERKKKEREKDRLVFQSIWSSSLVTSN